MANVKSRLKSPKSASKKIKKKNGKTKKTSTGLKKTQLPTDAAECHVVMKRPSNRQVMTPDEKVQYILQNGHKIKDKIYIKPPVQTTKQPKFSETSMLYRRKRDVDLPLMTNSGRIKKKKKCNMKLINSILKNELLINDSVNTKNSKNLLRAQPLPLPSVPIVNNNNDNAITDQNNTPKDFPGHNNGDLSTEMRDDFSDNADHPNEIVEKPKKIKKFPKKRKYKPKTVVMSDGLVLRLPCFECDYCHKTFNRKCSLRRHIMMHLGITLFSCPRCPQEFRSRYNMSVHVDRYHKPETNDPDIFVCNYCEEPFLVKKNLNKHIATHMPSETSFKCIYCEEVFPSHIMLMQHEQKHLVEGRYQCTLCSLSYRCRPRLYEHIKSHLKIKEFICQYCGKEFLRQNSLTRHVEIHHGGYRIVCPICKKSLKGHLTEHMRTHEKKRPHKCPECGQLFTQSTQLNVHRRAHTGARPYPCRICSRLFSHSNALMLHIRRHTGEKPFPCAMCPMSFSQLPHMKTHMRKIHGKENPYKCSNCDSFFKLKAQLDVHESKCTKGKGKSLKFKKKKIKDGKEIEISAPMSLSRMRFLLALLLTMIATKERLKYLGFNKRLIDDLLVESLEAMDQTPCKNETFSPLKRLRRNIKMLLIGTVPKDQMEKFQKENKTTEDILELLTNEKDK